MERPERFADRTVPGFQLLDPGNQVTPVCAISRSRQLYVSLRIRRDPAVTARVMTEVLTSFCARLYGRRGARNRAIKALGCAKNDIGPAALSQPRARMRL